MFVVNGGNWFDVSHHINHHSSTTNMEVPHICDHCKFSDEMPSTFLSYSPPKLNYGLDWCLSSSSSWVIGLDSWKALPFEENCYCFTVFLSLDPICCSFVVIWKEKMILFIYFWEFGWFNGVNLESQLSLTNSWLSLCLRWYQVSNLVQKGPRYIWLG